MKELVEKSIVPVILILTVTLATGCALFKKKGPEATQPTVSTTTEPTESDFTAEYEQARKAGALFEIYFGYDKYDLLPESMKKLDKTASWLGQNAVRKIRIEGNCDERGTNEYNIALGQRRADSAKNYLIKKGVAADRLATITYGEEQPVCSEAGENCWSKNRRDEFKIIE